MIFFENDTFESVKIERCKVDRLRQSQVYNCQKTLILPPTFKTAKNQNF